MTMKTIKIMVLMAAFTLVWGCSDDEPTPAQPQVETTSPGTLLTTFVSAEAPIWGIDWSWNDTKPDWQNPDAVLHECSMFVTLTLCEAYQAYSTDDDIVAVFLGGECRGVARRSVDPLTNKVRFLVMVAGNYNENMLKTTLMYYSGGLKHIFEMPGFYGFSPDASLGDDYDIVIQEGSGNKKYENYYGIIVKASENSGITSGEDDVVAVFVGDECRGTGRLDEMFNVYVNGDDEIGQLRYYNAAKGGIYTANEPIALNDTKEIIVKF